MQLHYKKHGFCYFAVDELATDTFIGFVGLLHQNFKSNYTPSVDIGWRLMKSVWGKGFASEAAKSCLEYAFSELKLNEIYSFATVNNKASEAIMKNIGMNYIDSFNHPYLTEYEDLKKCIVYTKNKFH
jgi:RimJ/RimL family protein N-acetyltransferase